MTRPVWIDRARDAISAAESDYFERFSPPEEGGRQSSVLILFGPHDGGGEDVVLTERAHTLRSQPGDVSFPGGKREPSDATPADAALRETHEEVGIDPATVEVVAELPDIYLSPRQFVVTPVLGWWREPGPVDAVDPREVHRAVRAPLSHLLDPAARFTVTHPSGYRGPGFEFDGLFIWGFTAGLLSAVLDFGGLTVPWDRDVERPLPDSYRPGGRRDALTQTATEGRS
ncbi:NUDIX hydrolase [Pedococcus sp. NPDC057267]|uniref:NUDIX hydrolase n=1 Tax=Pedococcus sp. NPDC057267 TaxID=3346077 RepID=UPI0036385DD9